MKVPQGFEKYYKADGVLLLKRTIYDLRQSTYKFWMAILQAFRSMTYVRSKADPCL